MRKRLLVLDDEVDFGSFVRNVAEDAGFEVVVLDDAHAFKSVYEKFAPHKIVLDVVMPEIDGIEIMKWLASVGSTASVVLVSGYSPNYIKAAELMAKAEAGIKVTVLTKPMSVSDLTRVLEE